MLTPCQKSYWARTKSEFFPYIWQKSVLDNNVNCENHNKSDILHSDLQVKKKKNHSHQIVHCVFVSCDFCLLNITTSVTEKQSDISEKEKNKLNYLLRGV